MNKLQAAHLLEQAWKYLIVNVSEAMDASTKADLDAAKILIALEQNLLQEELLGVRPI